MGKICKKSWIAGIFLGVMLFAAGFAFQATTVDAQAASTGFRTVGGQTFYYKKGKKVKGWVTVKGKKYFLNRKTGALYKGWMKSSKGEDAILTRKPVRCIPDLIKLPANIITLIKRPALQ